MIGQYWYLLYLHLLIMHSSQQIMYSAHLPRCACLHKIAKWLLDMPIMPPPRIFGLFVWAVPGFRIIISLLCFVPLSYPVKTQEGSWSDVNTTSTGYIYWHATTSSSKEQPLYPKLLLQHTYPVSKAEPSHPTKEIEHRSRLLCTSMFWPQPQ